MRTFREHESKESALKSIINSQESKKIRQGRAVSPLKLGSELVRSFVSQTDYTRTLLVEDKKDNTKAETRAATTVKVESFRVSDRVASSVRGLGLIWIITSPSFTF